jgi:peptide-methionine (S)-S-oxide reductase
MKPTLNNVLIAMIACSTNLAAAEKLPVPSRDITDPIRPGETRTAVFAGGCFWCTEAVFEQLAGVTNVVSGYTGDEAGKASYKKVSAGETKHAEAIQITYDPGKITYGQLLQVFFTIHDPTQKDGQGPDWGRQYRSAIFYATDAEKEVAAAYIKQLSDAKAFSKPIVTTLEPLVKFYPAEDYHQDFVTLNPSHPYVRQWVPGKLNKLRQAHPELLKSK